MSDEISKQMVLGYWAGRDPSNPIPAASKHPAYIHGFLNGRDDTEVSLGVISHPRRSAAQARQSMEYIKSALCDL